MDIQILYMGRMAKVIKYKDYVISTLKLIFLFMLNFDYSLIANWNGI